MVYAEDRVDKNFKMDYEDMKLWHDRESSSASRSQSDESMQKF